MRVKNRKCIRRLSFKSLWASRKRNIIAICAIALTTLMFTSLFTIMLSVNSSYETYNFRQAGGYSDGSFKDLSSRILPYPFRLYSFLIQIGPIVIIGIYLPSSALIVVLINMF